jgi:cyanate permease
MVLDRFQGAALAPAMGIMLSAWPLGIAATLVVLPGFASAELWRGGLLAAGIFAAAGLPLLALLPAAPPRAAADADADPGRGARLLPGEAAPLVAAGLVWAFYNTAFAIALGFTPALLVERGMAPEEAGWLASLVGWAILPLLPLGGWMVERLGRPVRAALACMAGMAAALLALALDLGPPGPALAAFGLLAAPPASLVMALAGRALSPASRPFGMGIYYTLFFAGMGALPPLAGLARDLSGHAAAPLLAGIGFLGVAMAALAVAGRLAARRGS